MRNATQSKHDRAIVPDFAKISSIRLRKARFPNEELGKATSGQDFSIQSSIRKDIFVSGNLSFASRSEPIANVAGDEAPTSSSAADIEFQNTPESRPADQDTAMDALRQRYTERLREVRASVVRFAGVDPVAGTQGVDYAALRAEAHKLAGSGATYGFVSISDAAGALEVLLDMGTALPEDVEDLARDLVTEIELVLRASIRPVAPAEFSTPQPPSPDAGLLPKILIIDDDTDVTEMVMSIFSSSAEVAAAHGAKEALEALETMRPDLVILDNEMPGDISGVDLLTRLRADPATRDLPVVMLTANASSETVLTALEQGATDYELKPFDGPHLRRKLMEMVRKTSARVLIVDDDDVVRELLDHKFRHRGYRTHCIADGAEAWDLLEAERFDLVVLDRMMPGMDGMTLLHRLRAQPRTADLPVVFLTALRYGTDVVDGLDSGASDYVTKPFDPNEVVARCEKYLRKART